MRIATWNVNFRRNVEAQVAAAMAHAPDLVVFQEVRQASFAELEERFSAHELAHFVTSRDEREGPGPGRFVVVASKFPLSAGARVRSPFAASAVSVEVRTPAASFDLVGIYVPTIARADGVKVPTQRAINERMREALLRPHVLCGDFNSPRAESAEGVTLFSRRSRVDEFEGEHALMGGLAEYGLTDAFRACNGYFVDDRSWYWKNRGRTGGYRLDHIFLSKHFRSMACWYDHGVREKGLSDHSLMVAEFEFTE